MAIRSIDALSGLVETTLAAYGNHQSDATLLQTLLNQDFASQQAENFSNQYTFLHQQPNQQNGFSASLFQDQNTGKKVLAIRGTEIPADIGNDLFDADVFGIGVSGYADNQAGELYRYWKQLITPASQIVTYTQDEAFRLFLLENPLTSSYDPASVVGTLDYNTFIDLLLDPPITGLGLVSPGDKVDVTGHSLGGHLAYLFDRMFPEYTDQVVTLNAPGLYGRGDNFLTAMGFPDFGNDDHITAVNAEGDLIHTLGNIHPGVVIDIAQETSPGFVNSVNANHSSINGVDSLNLMAGFGLLDTAVLNDPAGLVSDLLRLSSNIPETSRENLLDALRLTILGNNIIPTVEVGPTTRESFYDNIDALVNSTQFTALAGNLTFSSMTSSNISTLASVL